MTDGRALRICTMVRLLGLVALLAAAPARAELNCNAGIEFHPEGGIKRCNLNGHHTLHTAKGERLTCMNGHDVVKFPDGRLESCTLLEASSLGGVQCAARSEVELDHDGNLVRCNQS